MFACPITTLQFTITIKDPLKIHAKLNDDEEFSWRFCWSISQIVYYQNLFCSESNLQFLFFRLCLLSNQHLFDELSSAQNRFLLNTKTFLHKSNLHGYNHTPILVLLVVNPLHIAALYMSKWVTVLVSWITIFAFGKERN